MQFPNVVLRKDPQILAVLELTKQCLAPDYTSPLSPFLCHAARRAALLLDYDANEITTAILEALGTHKNGYPMTAGDFFSLQAEGLTANDYQVLRHQWLDKLIEEQK